MKDMQEPDIYDIYSLGYDKNLERGTPMAYLENTVTDEAVMSYSGGLGSSLTNSPTSASSLSSGSVSAVLYNGKTTFTDTTAGFRLGKDEADGIFKFAIGTSSSGLDWAVTTAGTLTITGAGLVSPTISYGKTSFSDSTHAGYYISSSGIFFGAASDTNYLKYDLGAGTLTLTGTLVSPIIRYGKTSFSDSVNAGYYISTAGFYVGAAADATLLKYTVSSGLFDFVGTISSRATATIASAINAGGNLINDIVNARLDSSSKYILSDFTFGATDYAGGVKAGDVTWNTTTGAITGGSGIVVYRSGIVGAKAGVTTFSITTAGDATFAGSLTAATGTLGALTIASGGNIKQGQTAYNTGTGFWLGDVTGTAKFSLGDGTLDNSLTWDGTTLMVNGSAFRGNDIFGSGVDGDVTISANTTLTSDMFYDDLTIDTNAVLTTAGYRIFVKGTLTIGSGCYIRWNGNNGGNGGNGGDQSTGAAGTAGTGGTALSSTSLYGSIAGQAGSIGGQGAGEAGGNGDPGDNGNNGTAVANSFRATSFTDVGSAGGQGGDAQLIDTHTGGVGGTVGTVGSLTASNIRPYAAIFGIEMFDKVAGSSPARLTYNGNAGGATGGGAGGSQEALYKGGGGGGGGGNGSNGGTVVICAKNLVNNGTIEAKGGNGGNGGNGGSVAGNTAEVGAGGGGGGGRGGAGGVIMIIYGTSSGSGSTSVVGGNGGNAGNGGTGYPDIARTRGDAGTAGSSGSPGTVITLQV